MGLGFCGGEGAESNRSCHSLVRSGSGRTPPGGNLRWRLRVYLSNTMRTRGLYSWGLTTDQNRTKTGQPHSLVEIISVGKVLIYVDESGQHTRGEMFISVAVCLKAEDAEQIRNRILLAEVSSGRGRNKWKGSSVSQKLAYLASIVPTIKELMEVFWRNDRGTAYGDYIAALLAGAGSRRALPEGEASFHIVVDGATPTECQNLRKVLKNRGLLRRSVVGARDDSEPLLRLADSLAGFVADSHKNKPYVLGEWERHMHLLKKLP